MQFCLRSCAAFVCDDTHPLTQRITARMTTAAMTPMTIYITSVFFFLSSSDCFCSCSAPLPASSALYALLSRSISASSSFAEGVLCPAAPADSSSTGFVSFFSAAGTRCFAGERFAGTVFFATTVFFAGTAFLAGAAFFAASVFAGAVFFTDAVFATVAVFFAGAAFLAAAVFFADALFVSAPFFVLLKF